MIPEAGQKYFISEGAIKPGSLKAGSLSDGSTTKTLSCIEHLLRLFWSHERFETDWCAIQWLMENSLIQPRSDWWEVTERGKVYVEGIRAVPLPEQYTEWRIPQS